jgi:catechol 2,3-dioxygenase-like lactoylglutathione lyase family enzyme
MIRGGNPTAFVSSLERSILFYVETLGFKMTARGEGWVEVDAGDGLVILLRAAATPPATPGAIAIGLAVDQPVADVVAVLANRGVLFREGAFFSDPDGNPFYLRETGKPP